jgi:O-succinylbenzoate synthase
MLEMILDSLRVISIPTKTNFRGINHREVALFQGPVGWAEFSPFLEYDDNECAPWLMCAIEAATVPTPKLLRTSIPVNATLPAVNGESEVIRILNTFPGCQTIKIKVGINYDEDLARIGMVRNLVPNAKIRIDVNGLWNVDQAHQFLKTCGEIEYVEQPCGTIEELRELKKLINIKIVGDEILRKSADPFAIDLDGAVDALMLKVQPLGGINRALRIAEHHDLPVVVSSALESAVGISYGLKLAAVLPELDFACGLATASLLTTNVAQLPIIDGKIEVADVVPEFDALEVDAERYEWWKNRIMRTAELIR